MVWTHSVLPKGSVEFVEGWLTRGFTLRNKSGKNLIVIITGDTGSGKSRLIAKIIEKLDPTFTPSLRNPPGPTRHLSVSPLPFFDALDKELLSPGTWWLLDEPVGVKNTEWMKIIGQALRDFATQGLRFKVVNLAICSPLLFDRSTQIDLRQLCHVWVRMGATPGNADVFRLKTRINYKSARREEVRVPVHLGPRPSIQNAPMPSEEFEQLYGPMKEAGWRNTLRLHMDKLREAGYIN